MARAQCIVHNTNRVLMLRQKYSKDGHEFWCLPGGTIEEGETPAEAAIRELKEECCVDGIIIQETSVVIYPSNVKNYTFLIDIGNQKPVLGTDPDYSRDDQHLVELKWLTLSEIPERDRAYLWAAGLRSLEEFRAELLSWGDNISYPQQENGK